MIPRLATHSLQDPGTDCLKEFAHLQGHTRCLAILEPQTLWLNGHASYPTRCPKAIQSGQPEQDEKKIQNQDTGKIITSYKWRRTTMAVIFIPWKKHICLTTCGKNKHVTWNWNVTSHRARISIIPGGGGFPATSRIIQNKSSTSSFPLFIPLLINN